MKVFHLSQKDGITIAIVAVFGLLGVILLVRSHAATPVLSLEPENATLSSGASKIADTTASQGSAVKFAPISTPPPTSTAPHGPTGNWGLTFDDEFSGTSLDLSKWEPNWLGEGGKMNKVGTYASNVSESGGEVRLQLSSASSGALIHTGYKAGHYQLPVGSYTEARINFPGSGTTIDNWPAWWANSTNNYPASGEHDIAEGLGDLTVNYHSPKGDFNQGTIPGIWSNAFHTYGLWRQPGKASVYWDGRLVKSYSTSDDGKPEDLILNIGDQEGPTVTGAAGAIHVDYVRAWKPI